jgi:hypothetical protein
MAYFQSSMKIHAVLLLPLLLSYFSASAQTCRELFTSDIENIHASLTRNTDWEGLKQLTVSIPATSNIPLEVIRDFSSRSGSLNAILKTQFRSDLQGLELLVRNMYFQIFRERSFDYKHIGELLMRLHNEQRTLARAKKGEWSAKRTIAASLLTLQQVFREALRNPKLDLLSEAGLFEIYGVSNLKELDIAIAATQRIYIDFGKARVPDSPIRAETKKIVFEIVNDVYLAGTRSDGLLGMVRTEHFGNEVESLIKKLHLAKSREDDYLEMLATYEKTGWLQNGTREQIERSAKLERLNFFIHAYVERFPREQNTSLVRRMSGAWFLNAVQVTEQFDHVYQINEARLSEILDTVVSFNNQIDVVLNEVESALETQNRRHYDNESIRKDLLAIREEVNGLHINELEVEDLSARLLSLESLQFRLSRAMESLLKGIDNENIEKFLELNFSWNRVVVGKSYEISGRDFDHVVFGKDVLSYFKRETALGDRSLAALNKGYVGRRGESGLRFITEIHKDLRYIKLMKGRKVRVIGRLKDRTIYFFAIYDRDETFDQVWLHNLIESH